MNDIETVSCKKLCMFLSRYSAAMLGCGATCIRLTRNVQRIAHMFGYEVEITVMPRHIHLTLMPPESGDVVTTIASPSGGISFNVNTRLSRLSWDVADGKVGFEEMERRFDNIIHSDDQNPILVLILASCANASFCRLFGGDFIAMGVVFIATMAGYFLKQRLLARKVDIRVVMMLCAFVSAVLASGASLFSLGSTPGVALGTSVLYLVPGIPFLNSFSDMLYRHYICSFSRFMDAMILTCCLSMGLCGAMLLMHLGMF